MRGAVGGEGGSSFDGQKGTSSEHSSSRPRSSSLLLSDRVISESPGALGVHGDPEPRPYINRSQWRPIYGLTIPYVQRSRGFLESPSTHNPDLCQQLHSKTYRAEAQSGCRCHHTSVWYQSAPAEWRKEAGGGRQVSAITRPTPSCLTVARIRTAFETIKRQNNANVYRIIRKETETIANGTANNPVMPPPTFGGVHLNHRYTAGANASRVARPPAASQARAGASSGWHQAPSASNLYQHPTHQSRKCCPRVRITDDQASQLCRIGNRAPCGIR